MIYCPTQTINTRTQQARKLTMSIKINRNRLISDYKVLPPESELEKRQTLLKDVNDIHTYVRIC